MSVVSGPSSVAKTVFLAYFKGGAWRTYSGVGYTPVLKVQSSQKNIF
jgi:hypothetical protein